MKVKDPFSLIIIEEIKQPSNSEKPFCVWIRGHFSGLTTGNLSRKLAWGGIYTLNRQANLALRWLSFTLMKLDFLKMTISLTVHILQPVFTVFNEQLIKEKYPVFLWSD